MLNNAKVLTLGRMSARRRANRLLNIVKKGIVQAKDVVFGWCCKDLGGLLIYSTEMGASRMRRYLVSGISDCHILPGKNGGFFGMA
jgi:hypothetical protein